MVNEVVLHSDLVITRSDITQYCWHHFGDQDRHSADFQVTDNHPTARHHRRIVNLGILEKLKSVPDSKVHGANMWPTWVLSAPDGPHVILASWTLLSGVITVMRCTIDILWITYDILFHNEVTQFCLQATLLPIWINFDSKWLSYCLFWRVGRNYLSSPKLQNYSRWSLGWIISSHILLDMWLFICAEIKVYSC